MKTYWWVLGYWLFVIFCGLVCMVEAKKKGRSPLWFFAGLFFNVLGLLLISVVSNIDEETRIKDEVHGLKIALARLENRLFSDATALDESQNEPTLCNDCVEYDKIYVMCRKFVKVLCHIPVAKCRYYRSREDIENQ